MSINLHPGDFLYCCEKLLSLCSFYNYSGQHCPEAIPYTAEGKFDLEKVDIQTRSVGRCLKESVNRGNNTNHWDLPKFIDMLTLPDYMDRLGSSGRVHVGFLERGLKNWAKQPAKLHRNALGVSLRVRLLLVFRNKPCSNPDELR